MRHSDRWMAAVLMTLGLGLTGCTAPASIGTGGHKEAPAKVEAIPGKDVKKVTLTEEAVRRTGIQTVAIAVAPPALLRGQPSPGTQPMTAVPYAAVLYDPSGVTWVYTVPQPSTYVREKVVVATVGGEGGTQAVLSAGPPVGTAVVTTGVIELYGAELGVGK